MKSSTHTSHDWTYRIITQIGLFIFWLLGLKISSTGAENIPAEGGAVLAITHFGYLDFALTEEVIWKKLHRKTRFLATAASFKHPIAGPLMRAMRHVPVDRAAGAQAYAAAVATVRSGELVGIFPEGSVDRSYTVRACKTGAIRLAAEAEVPLIPVAVWGGHRVITRGQKLKLRDRRRVAIQIAIGTPIHPTVNNAVQQTETLRTELAALIGQAQRDYPQTPKPGKDWWLPAHLGGSAPTPEQTAELDAADDRALAAKRRARASERSRKDAA